MGLLLKPRSRRPTQWGSCQVSRNDLTPMIARNLPTVLRITEFSLDRNSQHLSCLQHLTHPQLGRTKALGWDFTIPHSETLKPPDRLEYPLKRWDFILIWPTSATGPRHSCRRPQFDGVANSRCGPCRIAGWQARASFRAGAILGTWLDNDGNHSLRL